MITVRFDTRKWVASHGCSPKGRGSWAFNLDEMPAKIFFSPSMTLTDAKKWATSQVRAMDLPDFLTTVWVNVLP
jgi:hypothetical protein